MTRRNLTISTTFLLFILAGLAAGVFLFEDVPPQDLPPLTEDSGREKGIDAPIVLKAKVSSNANGSVELSDVPRYVAPSGDSVLPGAATQEHAILRVELANETSLEKLDLVNAVVAKFVVGENDDSERLVTKFAISEASNESTLALEAALPLGAHGAVLFLLEGIQVKWASGPTFRIASTRPVRVTGVLRRGVGLSVKLRHKGTGEFVREASLSIHRLAEEELDGVVKRSNSSVPFSYEGLKSANGKIIANRDRFAPIVVDSSFANKEVTVQISASGMREAIGRLTLGEVGSVSHFELALESRLPERSFAAIVRVEDVSGSVVPGALVAIKEAWEFQGEERHADWVAEGKTNAFGDVELVRTARTKSDAFNVRLIVRREGFHESQPIVSFTASAAGPEIVVLSRISGVGHKVRFLDYSGKPFAGIEVFTTQPSSENPKQVLSRAVTDSEGVAEVSGFPDDGSELRIETRAPGVVQDGFSRLLTTRTIKDRGSSVIRFLRYWKVELTAYAVRSPSVSFEIFPDEGGAEHLESFRERAHEFLARNDKPKELANTFIRDAYSTYQMRTRGARGRLDSEGKAKTFLASGNYVVVCAMHDVGGGGPPRLYRRKFTITQTSESALQVDITPPKFRRVEFNFSVLTKDGKRFGVPGAYAFPFPVTSSMVEALTHGGSHVTFGLSKSKKSFDVLLESYERETSKDGWREEFDFSTKRSYVNPDKGIWVATTDADAKVSLFVPEEEGNISLYSTLTGYLDYRISSTDGNILVNPEEDFIELRMSENVGRSRLKVKSLSPFYSFGNETPVAEREGRYYVPARPPGGAYRIRFGSDEAVINRPHVLYSSGVYDLLGTANAVCMPRGEMHIRLE